MSPADPLFILHHTNVDRIWSLWEECHNCHEINSFHRTQNSECYEATNARDGVNQRMPFWYFQKEENEKYVGVFADEADELREWWPLGFETPGSLMSISTLGDIYAYTYAADELDAQLLQMGKCTNTDFKKSFILLSKEEPHEDTAAYLQWTDTLLGHTRELVEYLKTEDLFSWSWFNTTSTVHNIDFQVTEIAATCECMYTVHVLNALVPNYTVLNDVSPTTYKMFNQSKIHSPNCFERLMNTSTARQTEREYCTIILNPNYYSMMSSYLSSLSNAVWSTWTNYFNPTN